MKIVVTGNMGYVGPVVVRHLRGVFPTSHIVGYDSGFFAHCLNGSGRLPETLADAQYFGDVRDVPPELFDGVDAVVHLAAVSNDPMGHRFERVTEAINYQSSVAIARAAAARGVQRFVFASSCSLYGYATEGARKESDALNPLTAYARSKAATEADLRPLVAHGMIVTALRFATACGMSDRLRLDLVLNDFVAAAIASKQIQVLSDGTPWRPLIDVNDMARAVEWAIVRDRDDGGAFLAVNVGCDQANYQIRDIAEAVAAEIPGTKVTINTNAPADKRSYRVDFSLYRALAPRHQPRMDLRRSVQDVKAGLGSIHFDDRDFRTSHFMRLRVLEAHIAAKRLSEDLRWL